MSPYDESMVISRTKLPNGATLTKLRPVEPKPNGEITVRHSRGKRLIRTDWGVSLALNDEEFNHFSSQRVG